MRSQPAVALLSNGSYSVMITSACAGYSTWRDLDVTRWREDATRDCWGQFYYVRDLNDESMWSIGIQPLPKAADESAFEFHPDRVSSFCSAALSAFPSLEKFATIWMPLSVKTASAMG
jgi:cellobiose phosphorylase